MALKSSKCNRLMPLRFICKGLSKLWLICGISEVCTLLRAISTAAVVVLMGLFIVMIVLFVCDR